MPVSSSARALLEVRDLAITYAGAVHRLIDGLNFDVGTGEVVGINGPSGCGKTTAALALLKLLPAQAQASGSAVFNGEDLLRLSERQMCAIRGRRISIIYQEPALALNPVMRAGDQVAEVLRAHSDLNSRERKRRVREMLQRVRLSAERYYHAYPHELSGGEKQRVVLAQALICNPALVIADEPTAGLDAPLRSEILELIATLREELETSFLLISHDANVTRRFCDRVIEVGQKTVEARASHRNAIQDSATANLASRRPLLQVRNLSKWYRGRGLFHNKRTEKHALNSVDLTLTRGELIGLVGPSGCGKSTLARCLALLERADNGEILFEDANVLAFSEWEIRKYRPQFQYIAQDPAAALNPRLSARKVVEEPLLIQGIDKHLRRGKANELLERVGLDSSAGERSCHQFSGGQKQRLVIARALAIEPRLLIFDESFSGLDHETRSGIFELLRELQRSLGITQLLISHDLELVSSVAESIVVMQDGRILDPVVSKELLASETWARKLWMQSPGKELVLTEAE
jgi:peptide/nickel transport system ATP-binding protein